MRISDWSSDVCSSDLALTAFALVAGACSDDGGSDDGDVSAEDTTTTGSSTGATVRVPEDHDTIQEAVDAANPGDLVLIAPGTYEEAVDVTVENLTIRGLDRTEDVLDGGSSEERRVGKECVSTCRSRGSPE